MHRPARRIAALCCCTLLVLAGCNRAAAPAPAAATPPAAGADNDAAQARRIEADVRFLADDLLEGRETATRGFDLAALYVAERLRALGAEPAGENGGYFQNVPLLRAQRLDGGGELRIERATGTVALKFRDEFLPQLDFASGQNQVTAPAAFVGQAVFAPELEQDDFTGIDLRGKIAVFFNGAPKRFDHDRRAFYSGYREKLAAVAQRGAIGAVIVATDDEEKRSPWARGALNWDKPGMRLRDADGRALDTFPQLRVVANVAAARAAAVLDAGDHDTGALFRQARDGKLRGYDLPGTLSLSARNTLQPAQSRNVVGRLPGRDPALRGEHVAFTAHLDHLGIGAPVKGDAIYNGALDNALGVAVMLEAARQLADSAAPRKRSLLFVALTGEEKGLLGAHWFADHPSPPGAKLVANVNMDMPVLLAPTTDVIPIGVEHSSLQTVLTRAAAQTGVTLSPDPLPEESIFIRSDQYAFIRNGVPAVYLIGGLTGSEAAKRQFGEFLRGEYHRPGDDVSQPIQYADAARLARLNARIGEAIAGQAQRPAWNAGDFFGEKFAKGAKP
ncbi:M20/M25/M40 family metallo-hydrolase [Lysobacter enzymogenes]|uniref:M20/M25/M40 family metallo-hydrolase n=1 Tax=Lysobacter enzymogenes TaxID=69 RepID=UPI000895F3AD|nr:M20/M25/M40 family metallo-hydrolase [Lysobacter enzymogenes]SDY31491.1 Zn-dependent amino-or carboxypeptidase, M28 family [Lysobacter enzymogenes]